MSERAFRRMTVADFLRWEDGTDTRYELTEGVPVAMAPPARAHDALAARLASKIDAALTGRPACIAVSEAGITRPDRDDTCYIADLAVSCTAAADDEQLVREPVLIVEILSPGTANFDRQTKVPGYRRVSSVAEILLIDSRSIFAEVLRREGERWLTELVQGPEALLTLSSIGLAVPMRALHVELAAVFGVPQPGTLAAGEHDRQRIVVARRMAAFGGLHGYWLSSVLDPGNARNGRKVARWRGRPENCPRWARPRTEIGDAAA